MPCQPTLLVFAFLVQDPNPREEALALLVLLVEAACALLASRRTPIRVSR